MRARWARPAVALLGALVVALGGQAAYAAPSPSPSASSSDGSAASAAPTPGGGDGDLASFGLAPSSETGPDGRSFLGMGVPPGSVVYDHVALVNQGAEPLDLLLYPADGLQVDGGGLGATARDEPVKDVGAWITLDTPKAVTVPAQTDDGPGMVIVGVTIAVPAGAEPGDHFGGIAAALVTQGSGGVNAPSVEFEQRVVARVYVAVQGEARPGLEVRDLSATWSAGTWWSPGRVEVTYTLTNTGNSRVSVAPAVRVAGPWGLLARTAAGQTIDELLPGSSVQQSVTVPRVWPLVREVVTVSAVAGAPVAGQVPGIPPAVASTVVWAIPWLVVVALLLILLLVVAITFRRRWRKQKLASAPAGSRRARRAGVGASAAPVEALPETVDGGAAREGEPAGGDALH